MVALGVVATGRLMSILYISPSVFSVDYSIVFLYLI